MKIRNSIFAVNLAIVCGAGALQAAELQDEIELLANPLASRVNASATSALSHLPTSGVQAVLSIPHSGALMKMFGGITDPSDETIGHIAVAVTGGADALRSASKAALLYMTHAALNEREVQQTLCRGQADKRDATLCLLDMLKSELAVTVLKETMSLHVPTLYIVVCPEAGHETEFWKTVDDMFRGIQLAMEEQDAQQERDKHDAEWVRVNDFVGVRFKLGSGRLLSDVRWKFKRSEILSPVAAMWDKRDVYVLAARRGDAVLYAVCENPDELAWPTSRDEAWDAHDTLAKMHYKGDSTLVSLWLDAEMSRALQQALRAWQSSGRHVLGEYAGLLATLDPANAALYAKAEASLSMLLCMQSSGDEPAGSPVSLNVWSKDGRTLAELQHQYRMPARSEKTSAVHARMLQDENTIFYFTASDAGAFAGCGVCGPTEVVESGLDVLSAYRHLSERPEEVDMAIRSVGDFLPLLRQFEGGVAQALGALAGPVNVVVQRMADKPASLSAASASVAMGLSAGVAKREDLADGWKNMVAAAHTTALSLGQDRLAAFIDTLPIIPRDLGHGRMRYLIGPSMILGLEPQVMVSDERWVLGSNSLLSETLLEETQTPLALDGWAAVLNMDALMDHLNKVRPRDSRHSLMIRNALRELGRICVVQSYDSSAGTLTTRVSVDALLSDFLKKLQEK